jgi:glycosyltransferase involved in cell wall biosynthesis
MTVQAQTGRARHVSVIVPTHSRPAMLRKALASIRAIEGPDLSFEILIGDNGDSPHTAGIAKEFGAIHLRTREAGATGSRNVALGAATGDYFTFLDDDDVWLPENIRPHLAQLEARPDLLAVIGQVIYADENLNPTTGPSPANSPGEGRDMIRAMLGDFFPQVGATVARMAVRDRVGYFERSEDPAEDVDWFLRLARTRAVGFQDTASILFRGRPAGTFDKTNRERVKAGRRVFLKHALAEWRIWRTPKDFFRGYRSRLVHFFIYFSDSAKVHGRAGRFVSALIGTLDAAYIFPVRTILRLVVPGPVRGLLRAGKNTQEASS